ncbi:hypothetical protein WT06_22215 [Burkholderia anthina]|nr:hypothetical protein WT06_22215 [Burkholderia anthina]
MIFRIVIIVSARKDRVNFAALLAPDMLSPLSESPRAFSLQFVELVCRGLQCSCYELSECLSVFLRFGQPCIR